VVERADGAHPPEPCQVGWVLHAEGREAVRVPSTCRLAVSGAICLVSSSHKSNLLFGVDHPSAMQSTYGVDMYMFMLLSFLVQMFQLFVHLMPVMKVSVL
jgi:hypothetical protein